MSEMRFSTFSALERLKKQLWTEYDHDRASLVVCVWDGEKAADAVNIFIALEEAASQMEADVRVELREIDSRDVEDQGPLVMALPSYVMYTHVQASEAPDIVETTAAEYRAQNDFFSESGAENQAKLSTALKENELNLPEAASAAVRTNQEIAVKPTLRGTLLGAYVLAARKATKLFGLKDSRHQTPEIKSSTLIALEQLQGTILRRYDETQPNIVICAWEGKCAADAKSLYLALKHALEKHDSNAMVHIKKIAPTGFETQGPLVFTMPTRAIYVKVRKYDAESIVWRTILNHEILEGLLYRESVQEEPRTLTVDELAALAEEIPAASRFFGSGSAGRGSGVSTLPERIPLLQPRQLAFIKPGEIKKLSIDRWAGLADGTAAAIFSAATRSQDEKQALTHKPENGPIPEAEQEFLTVTELLAIAENPLQDQEAAESEVAPLTVSQLLQRDQVLQAYTALCERYRVDAVRREPEMLILIGSGAGASEAEALKEALKDALEKAAPAAGSRPKLGISAIPCQFSDGLSLILYPAEIVYTRVKTADADAIVRRTFEKGQILTNLLYRDEESGHVSLLLKTIPLERYQAHILSDGIYRSQKASLPAALTQKSYSALALTLAYQPEEVLFELREANLRSRAGIGEPVWQKLDRCRNGAQPIFVTAVCHSGLQNFDAGAHLAAFRPHLLLEGMLIGAFAAGAEKGFIYIDSKNHQALESMKAAVQTAYENCLLGKNILDSGFSCDIEIVSGSETAVGGELTAILQCIEGKPAEPKKTPPFAEEAGLWGSPTAVDSAVTWAMIPWIMLNGARAFIEQGSKSSGGSFLITLVGAVSQSVIAEIPAGMKISTILQLFSDPGLKESLKAVQIGSISGQLLPPDRLEAPFDFALRSHAANRLGTTITVYNQNTCLLQTALNALQESADQACGKCLTCRAGLNQMIALLTKITTGNGTDEDLLQLTELAFAVRDSAMCSFGSEAPVALLSGIKYFRAEFEAHLNGHCPAGKCAALTDYRIDDEKCTGCGDCQPVCPADAIEGSADQIRSINAVRCTSCRRCLEVCQAEAIRYE